MIVTPEDGADPVEFLIPKGKHISYQEGEKIEKVLDVRDGPVGFVGNQTIIYSDAVMPEITEGQQTEKQYLIKVYLR